MLPAEPKCELEIVALLKRDPEKEPEPREASEDELPKCELSMLETARLVETAEPELRDPADSAFPSMPRLPFMDAEAANPRELPAKLELAELREPGLAFAVAPRELAKALEVPPARAPAVAFEPPLRPKYGIEPLRPNELGGVAALRLPFTPLRFEYELPRFAAL